MKKAHLITKDGKIVSVSPHNGEDFQLPELYSLLECSCIEVVQVSANEYMIIDESGALKEDRVENIIASAIYKATRAPKKEQEERLKEMAEMLKVTNDNVIRLAGNEEEKIYGNAIICNVSQLK